jgi:hypothetical protein
MLHENPFGPAWLSATSRPSGKTICIRLKRLALPGSLKGVTLIRRI